MESVSVLLADHQLLVKEAWHILFNKQETFVITGESSTTDETITMAAELKPQIIMFELGMPGINGVEAIETIKKIYPAVKILVVSSINDFDTVITALRNGASGYVTKNSSAKEVFKALDYIHKGHKYVCNELNEALIDEITCPLAREKNNVEHMWEKLTPAEKKVINYLQKGISSRQIADEMNLSPRTIEVHRYHILKKMQQPNTVALVSFLNKHNVMENGLS